MSHVPGMSHVAAVGIANKLVAAPVDWWQCQQTDGRASKLMAAPTDC